MNIAFFELEDWERKMFQDRLGSSHTLTFFDSPLGIDLLGQINSVEILVLFVNSQVTEEVVNFLPSLKCIATMSTGYDHINLSACANKNIQVSNVPTYGEYTVAEHTFALILTISRKIFESQKRIKEGVFSPEGLTGFDLNGKTLGVIGTGNIGRNVIKIAKGFGMNVIAYNRSYNEALSQELGFTYKDLDSVLRESDIITLHVPLTEETQHLINEEKFSIMKDGAIIINTSRGGVLDTTALLKVLDSGKIKAAGIDVVEEEPLLKEEKQLLTRRFNTDELQCVIEGHMLAMHPNVIMTPHNAFNSTEALQRIINTTIDNIEGFVSASPKNTVSK